MNFPGSPQEKFVDLFTPKVLTLANSWDIAISWEDKMLSAYSSHKNCIEYETEHWVAGGLKLLTNFRV